MNASPIRRSGTPKLPLAPSTSGIVQCPVRASMPSAWRLVNDRRARFVGVRVPTALEHHQRSWCADCWPSRWSEAAATGSAKARQALDDPAVRQRKGSAISGGMRAARDARIRAAGWEPEDWESRVRPALRAAGVTAAQVMEATGLRSNAAYRALQRRQARRAAPGRARRPRRTRAACRRLSAAPGSSVSVMERPDASHRGPAAGLSVSAFRVNAPTR